MINDGMVQRFGRIIVLHEEQERCIGVGADMIRHMDTGCSQVGHIAVVFITTPPYIANGNDVLDPQILYVKVSNILPNAMYNSQGIAICIWNL